MKRILAVLMALLVSFAPIGVFAAGSPTVGCMIRSNPAINYHLVNYDDSFLALLSDLGVEIEVIQDEQVVIYDESKWSLDEALTIEVDKPYGLVEWRLMREYELDDQVIALIVGDQTAAQFVLPGTILTNKNIIFDFSEMEPDIYYMFILRAVT